MRKSRKSWAAPWLWGAGQGEKRRDCRQAPGLPGNHDQRRRAGGRAAPRAREVLRQGHQPAGAEEERELVEADHVEEEHAEGDGGRQDGGILHRPPAKPPDRLQDDRDDDRLHPAPQPGPFRRRAVTGVEPGEDQGEDGGGEDEEPAADDEAAPTGLLVAGVDDHLGRVRAGKQVGCAEQVEEVFLARPSPPDDCLLAQHRDVGGRTAEGGAAELEGNERDRLQSGALGTRHIGCRGIIHRGVPVGAPPGSRSQGAERSSWWTCASVRVAEFRPGIQTTPPPGAAAPLTSSSVPWASSATIGPSGDAVAGANVAPVAEPTRRRERSSGPPYLVLIIAHASRGPRLVLHPIRRPRQRRQDDAGLAIGDDIVVVVA